MALGGRGWGRSFLPFPPQPLFHFLALVSFLAQPKPKIPLLGLSLLRKLPETHATQPKSAKKNFADSKISGYVWKVPKIVLTDNIQSGGNCSVYYYYLSFFGSRFISRTVKTENPAPRSFFASKITGNACYAA